MIISAITTDSASTNDILCSYWELKKPVITYRRRCFNAFDVLPSPVRQDISKAWDLGYDDIFAFALAQLFRDFELAPEGDFRAFVDGISAAVLDRFRREGSSAQSCTNRTNLRSRISPSGLALTDILLLNTDEGLSELNDLPPLVD